MPQPSTKGFFQITVTGPGNSLNRLRQFTKRLQKKVGHVYFPPGITSARRQIILEWASGSHRPARIGGTSKFIIITKRNPIDPLHIRGFFQWFTSCNNVLGITLQVQWMGDDAEEDLTAPSTAMCIPLLAD